jgi:hypothetical protein
MRQHLTEQELRDVAAARAARRAVARLARDDASVFNQFVLRDERTGRRIKQAPMHRRWHRLIDQHTRLVMWAHVDAGKTQQVSVGRVLWELGRNPNLRSVVITKTSDLAQKIVRATGQYIEKSDALREVFPDLRPSSDPSLPWTSQKLTVERSSFGAKEASVQAAGVYGNILGTRIDLLVLDDVIDEVNTRTATPRDHLWQWVRATLFGRLSEDARVVVMGNAWHPEDLLHRLAREPRFLGYRFPVRDEAGALTWPEHWSEDRIEKARLDMGPLEFSRALLCQARDDDTARFKREWIDRCTARGRGLRLLHTAEELFAEIAAGVYPDCPVNAEEALELHHAADAAWRLGDTSAEPPLDVRFYTGVDLAVQSHSAADLTCVFTIAVLPNGDRRVMAVESGRWAAPEILRRIADHHSRYGSVCIVENNAAQDYIVQILRATSAVPVHGFATGKQKASPEFGVESLAAEFEAGKWIIPSGPSGTERGKELDAWVMELIHYEPPPAHTGDRLMACWFAREGARPGERGRGSVGVRVFSG